MEYANWSKIDDINNATLVWTRYGDADIDVDSLQFGKGQIYSLIDDTDCMTDKGRLHELLKEAGALHLQPETYYLGNPQECTEFFRRVDKGPAIVWVSKEPDNSQGDGIIVNPDVNELRQQWLVDPSSQSYECRTDLEAVVLQQYITNPLLLNGKKMEIRTYWLIASLDPFLVFYHDGTVRLTTRDYKQDDWNDKLIHITNTKQQRESDPKYHTTEHERKWTVDQLADYLYKNGKINTPAEKWLTDYLRPTLKKYLSIVAKAAFPYLKEAKKAKGWDGRFELLGMDVILDSELRPWLTEIQMGPGLSRDRGIKEKVLPNMLVEMTDIILEIDYEYRSTGRVTDIQSLKYWEQVTI